MSPLKPLAVRAWLPFTCQRWRIPRGVWSYPVGASVSVLLGILRLHDRARCPPIIFRLTCPSLPVAVLVVRMVQSVTSVLHRNWAGYTFHRTLRSTVVGLPTHQQDCSYRPHAAAGSVFFGHSALRVMTAVNARLPFQMPLRHLIAIALTKQARVTCSAVSRRDSGYDHLTIGLPSPLQSCWHHPRSGGLAFHSAIGYINSHSQIIMISVSA